MTTPTRDALIAAGWRVYRPGPGRARPMHHGRQAGPERQDSGSAWAWIEREYQRDVAERGRALAQQIRRELEA